MEFERDIPELKKYDSISFLHQPMASGQPLKIVQRHMAHPVVPMYLDIKNEASNYRKYSSVPNRRACTFINFEKKIPPIRPYFGLHIY